MTTNYELHGRPGAPVVVLSSSLGTTMSMWDPQLTELAERFRVLRYDHRGHGGSSAPGGPYTIAELAGDVVALLDRLRLAPASIVGLSLGGMVAMWLAAHVPNMVDRLVLCCTAPQLGTRESWHERAATVRANGTGVLLEALLDRWLTPGFREANPGTVALVREMLESAQPDGYASCCEAIATMDQRRDLARIAAPTLVVAGELDPVVPPSLAAELQGAVAGATLAVVPDAAHLCNLEQPAAFTSLLVDHLGA